MLEAVADQALTLADRYGVVVLLVAFVLEGAVVGKLLPTRALLIAVVVAAGTSLVDYAAVFVAAVLGATIGQLLLFLAVRRLEIDPTTGGRIPLETDHVDRATRWFDRWGPAAIAVTNSLPVARGSLTVPTAMGQLSTPRFTTYSVVGSSCYVGGLVAVAVGLDGLLSTLLGGDADVATVATIIGSASPIVGF